MRESRPPATLADAHAHLDGSSPRDLQQALEEARAAGVEAVLAVGMDLESSTETVHLSRSHDFIKPAVGIHPWNARDIDAATYESLKALALRPEVAAIGEVGLDMVREGIAPPEVQRRCLTRLLGLALEAGKPLNLHCRGAHREMMDALRSANPAHRGTAHGFTGDGAMLRDWLELGFYITIGRSILGDKSAPGPEVVRLIPLNRLLLETDSSPRYWPDGVRVTPAAVRQVAERVAEIRGASLDTLAQATSENFRKLFGAAS
ncbi:MAG: TatD family hydrolase [Chloroflexi bacterium]|nr:TatD family hydrolase [Chloroflexota bacterium]